MGSMGDGSCRDLVYDIKLSSVVPSRVTGENTVHELTNMDIAMKLHYIRGLYLFRSEAAQGLDIFALKKPMFQWLDLYYPVSGRIRGHPVPGPEGRQVIKCNDGGVRIVEAHCRKSLQEWLPMAEDDQSLNDQLVYNHVLGPDLSFSPLVFIQFTWFKCGGLSVGLSWAHILGDIFSASTFMNSWAHIMAGQPQPRTLDIPSNINIRNPLFSTPIPGSEKAPFSLKRVGPVGDRWLAGNGCEMGIHSFHFTAKQITRLSSGLRESIIKSQSFQVLAALMWRSLAKIRGDSDSEQQRVVIISRGKSHRRENELASNIHVAVGTVKADFLVAESDLRQLVKLIDEERVLDETDMIYESVERESKNSDFILYGANLTLVNVEEAEIYGLQLNGQKPVFANYSIAGIGDGGVVLVLPGPETGATVTVIVPMDQIAELKKDIRNQLATS